MITLGIESSCDETSVAILDDDRILANMVYSQIEHASFGGVVPEIASRAHLEKIGVLAEASMAKAGVTVGDLDLLAVTDSPGLAGALLVGVSFALGLHARTSIPIAGINHLEGHICSIFLEHPELAFPFLALVVSGGHTTLYLVKALGSYTVLGQTVDDAAGEAFDKVGKLLGFSYPAGRAVEEEAKRAADNAENISFPRARVGSGSLDFSFSGVKTAVKYFVSARGDGYAAEHRGAILRAFQEAVVGSLVENCAAAVQSTGIGRLVITGGVACNGRLREAMRERLGGEVFFPPPPLCMDNGAMIACAARRRQVLGINRPPHVNPNGAPEND